MAAVYPNQGEDCHRVDDSDPGPSSLPGRLGALATAPEETWHSARR